MRIKGVRRAWFDFEEAVGFIARDNPEAARKMARRIREAARLLAEHPGAGRPDRVPGPRELVNGGTPFILPYRVKDNTVQVLRVLHSSRKWPRKL
jgi:toxin ParE1/3/4